MSLPCLYLVIHIQLFSFHVNYFGLQAGYITRKDLSRSYTCCLNGPKFLKVQNFELTGYIVSKSGDAYVSGHGSCIFPGRYCKLLH